MSLAKSRRRIAQVKYVTLTVFLVPWVLVPLWVLIVNSFKSTGDAGRLSLALPEEWALVDNYTQVFTSGDYPRALANSLAIVIPTIFLVLLFGSLAAWAYARSTKLSMRWAYNASALSILLPAAILPTLFLLDNIGLGRNAIGYIAVTMATRFGIVVFLTTGFIRSMPKDLEEAAAIDGANRLTVYFRVILPLISPILFVGGILLVLSVWNEFFFASFLLPKTEQATLPLALYRFSTLSAGGFISMRWNLIFAHIVMTSLPLVLVYLFAQRRVLAGLTEGGVKG